jgi:hypothetical protein
MKFTNKTLRACALDMGLKINFANKREVALFKSAVEFNARRRSATEKYEFWDTLIRKRGCNARSIWNCASQWRGRRVVKLARAVSETQNPQALYWYSNKLRSQKCYELANMSHDYATRLVRKQNNKRA